MADDPASSNECFPQPSLNNTINRISLTIEIRLADFCFVLTNCRQDSILQRYGIHIRDSESSPKHTSLMTANRVFKV